MSFRTALSGISAATSDLNVTSHNIANVNTPGFKASRTDFAEVFAVSPFGLSRNAIGSGVRVASVTQQFAQGNIEFTDSNLDLAIAGQGFFTVSDSGSLAYTRAGNFSPDRDGFVSTPSGQRLQVFPPVPGTSNFDSGRLVDLRLSISESAPVATTRMNLGTNLPAQASRPAVGAFDPSDAQSYNHTTSMTVYDSLGVAHVATTYYVKTATPNQWAMYSFIDGTQVGGTAPTATRTISAADITGTPADTDDTDGDGDAATGVEFAAGSFTLNGETINFGALADQADVAAAKAQRLTDIAAAINGNATLAAAGVTATVNGAGDLEISGSSDLAFAASDPDLSGIADGTTLAIAGPSGILQYSSTGALVSPTGGTVALPPYTPTSGAAPMTLELDVSASTQFGERFAVNDLRQDGAASGRLTGIEVSPEGVVLARYTNGQSQPLGQVAMTTFANPQGLSKLGDNMWGETFTSGQPIRGQAGSSAFGLIESGALEGSNVDLTEQLVNMITAQRNFQANAQTITTNDTVMQTVLNIR